MVHRIKTLKILFGKYILHSKRSSLHKMRFLKYLVFELCVKYRPFKIQN